MDQVSPTGIPPSEEQEKGMPYQKEVSVFPYSIILAIETWFPAVAASQESTKNVNAK